MFNVRPFHSCKTSQEMLGCNVSALKHHSTCMTKIDWMHKVIRIAIGAEPDRLAASVYKLGGFQLMTESRSGTNQQAEVVENIYSQSLLVKHEATESFEGATSATLQS